MSDPQSDIALLLSGGDARVAYQAGATLNLRDIGVLGDGRPSPLDARVGASAGALNIDGSAPATTIAEIGVVPAVWRNALHPRGRTGAQRHAGPSRRHPPLLRRVRRTCRCPDSTLKATSGGWWCPSRSNMWRAGHAQMAIARGAPIVPICVIETFDPHRDLLWTNLAGHLHGNSDMDWSGGGRSRSLTPGSMRLPQPMWSSRDWHIWIGRTR